MRARIFVAVGLCMVVICWACTPEPAGDHGPTGTLVVTNMSDNTATVIDVASREVLATIETGEGPHEVATSRDGKWAVVTNYGVRGAAGHTLTLIDLERLEVDRLIDLGDFERPHGIAFLPGDTTVVVTSEVRQEVALIDLRTDEVAGSIPTGFRASHMLALVPSGRRVYTANVVDGNITELNLLTGETTQVISVARFVEGIAVSPDGRTVWVGSNGDSLVGVVDVATGTVVDTITGFGMPYRLAVAPSGAVTVIADPALGQIRILNANTHQAIRIIDVPAEGVLDSAEFPGSPSPEGVAIASDSRFAYVTLQGRNQVVEVDLETGTITGHMNTGAWPDGIAYSTLTRPRE